MKRGLGHWDVLLSLRGSVIPVLLGRRALLDKYIFWGEGTSPKSYKMFTLIIFFNICGSNWKYLNGGTGARLGQRTLIVEKRTVTSIDDHTQWSHEVAKKPPNVFIQLLRQCGG